MSKKYYWLKLPKDFFVDPKIKKLRRIAGGDTYVIIYLKMMLLVINTDGILVFEGIEQTFAEELADNIKVVLAYLTSQGEMIEIEDDQFLLQRVKYLIGIETDAAERKRKQRKKEQGVTLSHDSHDMVTTSHTEKEKEKDIESCFLKKEESKKLKKQPLSLLKNSPLPIPKKVTTTDDKIIMEYDRFITKVGK
ncbi:MAG: phage replisome organizer N-terminal domain-containing protein [Campylobacteraceae bacterium]|nr:phage replisome organizer N-terminal domain-containing protein [Campylobacteraceae bacterium]